MKSNLVAVILANVDGREIGISSISDLFTNEVISNSLAYCNGAESVVLGLSNSLNNDVTAHQALNGIDLKFLPRTKGALASLSLMLDLIPEDKPVAVVPTNSFIKESMQDFYEDMQLKNADVGVVLISSHSPDLSYVRTVNARIVEIHEKEVVSDLAISGHYYFKNKKIIRDCLNWAMLNNINKDGLLYIAPSLNYCVTRGMEIASFIADNQHYIHRTQSRR